MTVYHKIQTIFKRDPDDMKRLLIPEWTFPEFGYLANNPWDFTEKVDGTNIRVMIDPILGHGSRHPIFCGKSDEANISPFLVKRLEERFNPLADAMFEKFPHGAILYGEGYGARIQKGGGNYRPDVDFVLFDVFVTSEDGRQWFLRRPDVEEVAISLGLDIVPIIGSGTLYDMIDMVKAGFDSRWGAFKAEGIVARPQVELRARGGERIITKLKHRDFPKEKHG